MISISLSTWNQSYKRIVSIHYLKKRLNLKFLVGIIKKIYKESKNKNTPWLTNDAINCLKLWIKPSDTILEFGSGASTVWFSKFSKKIISVEHDKKWYTISKKLTNKKHSNVELIFAPTKKEYLQIFKNIPKCSIDICLIDGQWRHDCLLGSFSKIKIGGLIILDNAETYLPVSWNSNSFQNVWELNGSPNKKKVKLILNELKNNWRMVVTTDVSQDTLIL